MEKFITHLEGFAEACEATQHTDTGIAWTYLVEAKKLIKEHLKQEPIFEVLTVSRDDIEGQGYDASGLSDEQMEKFADQLGESLMENDYWAAVDSMAEAYELAELDGDGE